MSYNRRTFIKGMVASAAAIPFSGAFASEILKAPEKKYPIAFFTKPLDIYGLDFVAETLAMAGLDGFDLTVRPGGMVEPESVVSDLPKVIKTGKKYNLNTEMMVTSITDSLDANSERVLKTAAGLGIKHYRLGYYDYDFKKGIWETLGEIKKKMELLAKLNEAIDIQGGYQNHSGTKVGAPMWDVWELIRNLPPEFISSQFDVRHAVTEGAASWILAMRLLSKNIGSLAIKDFTWGVTNRNARVVSVPLGEGIVNFNLYFKTLKELNITAPISLHIEYPLLSKEEESLSLVQKQKVIVSKIKKDVDFIRSNLVDFKMI